MPSSVSSNSFGEEHETAVYPVRVRHCLVFCATARPMKISAVLVFKKQSYAENDFSEVLCLDVFANFGHEACCAICGRFFFCCEISG